MELRSVADHPLRSMRGNKDARIKIHIIPRVNEIKRPNYKVREKLLDYLHSSVAETLMSSSPTSMLF